MIDFKRISAVIIFVILISCGPGFSAGESTNEISGTVVYPDGAPAPGVTLSLMVGCDKSETTTDSDGRYRASVKGGTVFIQSIHGDYVLGDYAKFSENAGQALQKDLKFQFACLVLGEVTDASTGAPIEGAGVRISGGAWLIETKTGDDGLFKHRIPHGAMMMIIEKDGYVIKRFDFSTQNVDTSAWRVPLKPAGTVRGRVIDQYGQPVAGASVKIVEDGHWARSVNSDENGNYEMKNVDTDRPVELDVRVDEGSSGYQQTKVSFPEGTREVTADLTVRRAVLRKITGKVTDQNGSPISGASVIFGKDICMVNAQKVKTNENGDYIIDGVASEKDMVHAQAEGFAPVFMAVDEGGDQRIDMKMGKAHSAEVRVVDPSGKAIPGAIITVCARTPVLGRLYADWSIKNKDIYRWLYTTTTGQNGGAVLNNLPADGTVIDVSASGLTSPMAIAIRTDSTDNVIKLQHLNQITGKVTDAVTGAPIQCFIIKWKTPGTYVPGGENSLVFNNPKGEFSVSVEAGGKYAVKVLADGYIGEENTEEASVDARNSGLFKLRKTFPLKGKITDSSGKNVSGAQVTVVENGGSMPRIKPREVFQKAYQQKAVTGPDGSFTIDRIIENIATVIVEHKDYPQLVIDQVDLTKPVNHSLIIPASLSIKAAGYTGDNANVEMTFVEDNCYHTSLKPEKLPADGHYTRSILDPGDYIVMVRGEKRVELRSVKLKSGEKYTLDLDQKRPVVVKGVVTSGSKPAPGVHVGIRRGFNEYDSDSVTDSQGCYVITVDDPGPAELQQYQRIDGELVGYLTQHVGLKKGENVIDLKVPLGSVSGRLVDARTGVGLEDEIIETQAKWTHPVSRSYDHPYLGVGFGKPLTSTRTAKDGSFTLNGLPDGPVVLTVTTRYQNTKYVGSPLTVNEKEPLSGVEVKMDEPGMLQVTVVDSKTGKPAGPAIIQLQSPDKAPVVTDNRYTEGASVPAGSYVLWVDPLDSRYFPGYADVEIKPGKTAKVWFKVNPAAQRIVFKAPESGRLKDFKGRQWIGYELKDAATGKPVLMGQLGPEWGGYLPGFNAKNEVAIPIKPGTYTLDAVLRNTEDYLVDSKANLWKTHQKVTVKSGQDAVITVE